MRKQSFLLQFIIPVFLIVVIFLLPSRVSASQTDGTIDSTYKYAWSENIGWINFGTSGGNVHITDSELTGYAWSANYGWINLAPATSGVTNNGEGTLSGSAWGENTGWIDFGGVTIDSNGYFIGYASGTVTAQISFNCANTDTCSDSDFKVRTDWRPRSARPACNNSLDDDGDGLIDYPDDPGCSSLDDNDETDPAAPPPSGGGGGGGGDTTVPSISQIETTTTATSATIAWKTNESSISWVVYGTSADYGEEVKTTSYTTSHSATLTNLSPETTYHYQIKSKDSAGNIGSYTDKTFTTLAEGERVCAGADFNSDGKIDLVDFGTLVYFWGSQALANPCVDINADGIVDLIDFGTLIFQWTG